MSQTEAIQVKRKRVRRLWRDRHDSIRIEVSKSDAAAWRAARKIARRLGLSVGETLLLGWPVLMRRAIRAGIDPRELPVREAVKTTPPKKPTPRVRDVRPQ